MLLEKKYYSFLTKNILCLCLIFFAFPAYAEQSQKQRLQEPINQLHETLINIMVISDSTNFEERYKYLEPIINECFDINLISKVVLVDIGRQLRKKIKSNLSTYSKS